MSQNNTKNKITHCNISVTVKRREDNYSALFLLLLLMIMMVMNHFVLQTFELHFSTIISSEFLTIPYIYYKNFVLSFIQVLRKTAVNLISAYISHEIFQNSILWTTLIPVKIDATLRCNILRTCLRKLFHSNQFLLKVQSFKLYN